MSLLQLDYDLHDLDYIIEEVRKLREICKEKFGKELGRAVILESRPGRYLVRYEGRDGLEFNEWSWLMGISSGDAGHIRYSRMIEDITIRYSEKPTSGIGEPRVIIVV